MEGFVDDEEDFKGNRELGQESVRTLSFRFCTFGGLSSVRLDKPQGMVV